MIEWWKEVKSERQPAIALVCGWSKVNRGVRQVECWSYKQQTNFSAAVSRDAGAGIIAPPTLKPAEESRILRCFN